MTNPGVTYEQAVEVVEALKANAGNQVAAAKQLLPWRKKVAWSPPHAGCTSGED